MSPFPMRAAARPATHPSGRHRLAAGWAAGVMVLTMTACSGDDEAPSVTGESAPTQEPAPTTTTGTLEETTEQPAGTATPTASETQGPTDTATTSPQQTGGGGDAAVLEYVTVQVPEGWQVQDMGGFRYDGDVQPDGIMPPHQWCLVPAEPGPAFFGCAGVSITVGGDWLPGHDGQAFDPDQPFAWYAAVPPVPCPFDPVAANPLSTGGDGLPVQRDMVEVGGEQAHHAQWEGSCEQGDHSFTPESWYLPEGRVLIVDRLGHEATAGVVDSIEVDPF